jgi:peptidoglycan/LPS O-acetylase OafA/YrhL
MTDSVRVRPRLPALTSIRFFAALWVALFHMEAMKAFSLPIVVRQLASIGYSGVSFFFVLSGFILVYTYLDRPTTKRAFWQARFARVYPALAFALLITGPSFFYCVVQMRAHNPHLFVPEWAWSASHVWLTGLLSITLLQSWVPQAALAWNMPNWSLSVEVFFYFLFPFLLPRMARLSRRQLVAIVPAGWLLTLACTLVYTHLHPEGAITTKTIGPWVNTLKFNPLVRLPEFLMGMATGLLFLRNRHHRKIAWPLILTGLAAVAVVVALSERIPYLAIHTALLAPAFAVITYGFALRPAGMSLLNNRVMEALGEASYPFYLLHSMVIITFFINMATGQTRHQTWLGLATWLLIAVVLALLVDRFIERPLRRLLRPRHANLAPLPPWATGKPEVHV